MTQPSPRPPRAAARATKTAHGPNGSTRPQPVEPPAIEDSESDRSRQWREPQHERGRRRVDAILDAASAILLEGGLAALSMDAVTKRSQTSKSSMYHFFPDRDAIVRALAERHVATITAYKGFAPGDPAEWAGLTTEAVVDRYLEPFARYVADHPDILPCMQAAARLSGPSAAEAALDNLALERAARVIAGRLPHAKPAERRRRATTLYAVTVGTMEVMSRLSGGSLRTAALRELRQVLIAYIRMIEHDAGA